MALAPIPTLHSLLKLYISLNARKLTGFLDAVMDEEEVLSWMMVMKNTGCSVGRVWAATGTNKDKKNGTSTARNSIGSSLLDGQWMSISDLNFVIDEVSPWCPVSG